MLTETAGKMYNNFVFEEYSDHIEIIAHLNSGTEVIDIPAEIKNKPVTVISDRAFFDQKCKIVNIPDSVKTIGPEAFALCRCLTEAIIPDSITNIGRFAYRDCKNLRKIEISSSLKCLPYGIFSFCYLRENTKIILKEGLEEIEGGIFYSSVGSLLTLNIPKSVKRIATGAFEPGMKIITTLPIEERWFKYWPYDEKIISRDDGEGKVNDSRYLDSNCIVFTVSFENGSVEKFFFPEDFISGKVRFDNAKTQKNFLNNIKDMGAAHETYELWAKGLI